MASRSKVVSLEAAAGAVPNGARIAFGGGGATMRRPMSFARALVRHGTKDLRVHHFLAGLEVDVLIACGAVASTHCAYVGLLEHGQAPAFQRAARDGEIQVFEYSEFLFSAGLRAAELGIPFVPWKTPWGSQLVQQLGLKTVKDPYGGSDHLAVPAMQLDVAVIHVERCDEDGYITAPAEPDLVWDYDWLIARVAKHTIVCAEEIAPPPDPARVAVIGREIAAIVHVPHGAWPTGLYPLYPPDVAHITDQYIPAVRAGGAALTDYISEHVLQEPRREHVLQEPRRDD